MEVMISLNDFIKIKIWLVFVQKADKLSWNLDLQAIAF